MIEYPVYLPSRRQFQNLLRHKRAVPVAACLPLEATAQDLFKALAFRPPHILLESARTHPVTGRYSLIVGEPTAVLTAKAGWMTLEENGRVRTFRADPLGELQKMLDQRQTVRIAGFPPFVGGAVGFFGFDCYQYVEPVALRLPAGEAGAVDDLQLPDIGFFFFNEAVVLDQIEQKLWVIALAKAEGNADAAYDQAVGRIDVLLKRLTGVTGPVSGGPVRCRARTVLDPFLDGTGKVCGTARGIRAVPLLPPVAKEPKCSTHTRESFEAMVRQAKAFIARGEIYQANLSQRFEFPLAQEPWRLYECLASTNPSPFAAYADLGFLQIVSASPERFLRVEGECVETRPIAGTRPKGPTADENRQMREELLLSPKERAEHLMLVDLERNDLGRVCRYGSVAVDELMTLEEYSHVIHIVSNVRGVLKPNVRPIDLIAAAFPGGTITGCPKIRSIEIIDALEPVRRQLYTGSLGFISATGDLDLNLLIRTACIVGESVYVQAGAGIVADSDPSREYEETLHKAQALMDLMKSDARLPEQLVTAS